MRPHVSDDQRRARLLRRQLLDPTAPDSPEELVDTVVGLHATTASTVHLSAWARDPRLRPERLEQAMYTDRSLVKQLAMRRTLFVLTRPLLAAAVGAVGARVAASERTNLLRDLRRDGPGDPEGWLAAACEAVVETLDGATCSTSELRAALPEFDRTVEISPGKSYGGPSPLLPRVVNHLAARGEVVRGASTAPWHQARNTWTAMRTWLGEDLEPLDPHDGHVDMVRRWLQAYGPGTEADLVWWLGSTKTAVRKALAALEAVEVELDSGAVGYLLPGDLDDVEPVAPRALLLPALDPTTMGYIERGFYLGDHAGQIFDSTGNGGQTAWWDGRIVGGWVQRPDAQGVEVVLLEDLPRAGRTALDERAGELSAWLGDDRPVAGFPSPLMRAALRGERPGAQ
ncbi:winged helix DNA-binding domain-containing protein [Gordonia caeni]|uniref:Winged helix DNA-binding domain-containing protein n=1 Tax=Gordonia caeni TaxID=1007097 RepID=A0ABP7PQZ4_9ACTN